MTKTKTWDELTIKDNFLFQKVMRNKRICKMLIEEILQIKIKKIAFPDNEKTIDIRLDSKSVRLDVYVQDDQNTIYDIEMQTTNNKGELNTSELPKRTRYYQAMIDMDLIEKGQTYDCLNQTYIIFICTFDPYDENRYTYTFHNLCEENPTLQLGDQTTKLFLNAKGSIGNVTKHTKAFLDYVNGIPTKDKFTQLINNEVLRVKKSEDWRREYMTLAMELERTRKEGLAEGLAEGLVQGINKTIIGMLKKGLDYTLISEVTGVTIDAIQDLAKKNHLI